MPFAQRGLVWVWLSALVLLLDQLSKSWASEHLTLYVPQKVTGFFNLTLMHNKGMAFSLLANESGWQRYFLSILAVAIVIWLLVWMFQNKRSIRLQNVALALVIGGALGNVWDRVMLGYVVDFIELHYHGNFWPAFNVADSAIFCGAVLLIIDAIINKEGANEDSPG